MQNRNGIDATPVHPHPTCQPKTATDATRLASRCTCVACLPKTPPLLNDCNRKDCMHRQPPMQHVAINCNTLLFAPSVASQQCASTNFTPETISPRCRETASLLDRPLRASPSSPSASPSTFGSSPISNTLANCWQTSPAPPQTSPGNAPPPARPVPPSRPPPARSPPPPKSCTPHSNASPPIQSPASTHPPPRHRLPVQTTSSKRSRNDRE